VSQVSSQISSRVSSHVPERAVGAKRDATWVAGGGNCAPPPSDKRMCNASCPRKRRAGDGGGRNPLPRAAGRGVVSPGLRPGLLDRRAAGTREPRSVSIPRSESRRDGVGDSPPSGTQSCSKRSTVGEGRSFEAVGSSRRPVLRGGQFFEAAGPSRRPVSRDGRSVETAGQSGCVSPRGGAPFRMDRPSGR
jgi:hypothetical protein